MVRGGKGNDKLLKGYEETPSSVANTYKLLGEDGNDVLEASANVEINGGRGVNVIKVDSTSSAAITQGTGSDYIHLSNENVDNMTYSKEGNDLIIENGSRTVLKDYFRYGARSSIKGIIGANDTMSCDENFYKNTQAGTIVETIAQNNNMISLSELLSNGLTELLHNEIKPARNRYIGTEYNDRITSSPDITPERGNSGLVIDGEKVMM